MTTISIKFPFLGVVVCSHCKFQWDALIPDKPDNGEIECPNCKEWIKV